MKKNLLLISNGRGEDSIAITVLEQLKRVMLEEGEPVGQINVIVLPLVDDGSAYKSKGYDTAATWKTLPSKGFGASNLFHVFQDIRKGLWDILRKQKQVIVREAETADLIVTVGDIIPLIFACLWGNGKKIVHIGTAISAYIRNYSLLEIWLFKKYTSCVICRDMLTVQKLREFKVPAVYYGNPMMDDPILKKIGINLGVDKKKKHIVLVPSSREDAYDNILRMLQIIKKMGKRPSYSFLLSLAPNLNLGFLAKTAGKHEWSLKDYTARKKPLLGELENENANSVYVVKGYFRDCLEGAVAVLGMTGTGNEQIVGLGLPLILLRGKSEASSWKRLRHYQKLLGEAVLVTSGPDKKVVQQITDLLENNRALTKMSEAGKSRMGEPGGAYFIARKILYHIYH